MSILHPPRYLIVAISLIASLASTRAALLAPTLDTFEIPEGGGARIVVNIPPGFRHAVLERLDTETGVWENLVAGPLNGATNSVTFFDPTTAARNIYRITAGEDRAVPAAPLTGATYFTATFDGAGGPITGDALVQHVLNRVAYGPGAAAVAALETTGVISYIDSQLDPGAIDESGNSALDDRVGALFYSFVPGTGTSFLGARAPLRYLKGTAAPPNNWMNTNFDDAAWASTSAPIGYGTDFAYADPLTDMAADPAAAPPVPGYFTFYARQEFTLPDPATLENPFLDILYDDSFIAYLNGVEIARANITGPAPPYTQSADATAGNIDRPDSSGTIDLAPHLSLLQEGTNVLAVEIHNGSIDSSDAGLLAEVIDYPDSPYPAIRGARELQHLIHLRGIYSARQLQAVLGEFWENHFTTDFDKVEKFLRDLGPFKAAADISADDDARIRLQAKIEAAHMEWTEYEFFYDNALGYFGDLLLRSASSPPMLIYLDNVFNTAANPNENYAREIFELSAFGVDNGYTQTDIEQLAKCFTGWTVRKIHAANALPFPASARTPPTDDSVAVATETVLLDLGAGWKYFKGTAEPAPGPGGVATTLWTAPGFDDSDPLLWAPATTGIGYGDGDDATVLTDMRQSLSANPPVPGYASIYLRREFTLDPSLYEALRLAIDYDDGFVAYLNGSEIARSNTMSGTGSPPAFGQFANFSHEAGTEQLFDLAPHAALFNTPPATNILAIQVHNKTLTSSDLSMRPRIISQTFSPESILPTDPAGVWAFRFDPAKHNLDAKTLFAGSPYQAAIPADRTGPAGVNDAIDVVDAMAAHPSAAEFICLKLVNRFVSDEISLDTYQDRSAPAHLLEVMDNAVAAWGSTTPAGHIGTVMRAVLDLDRLTGAFWMEASRANKVKNPIEFINSAYRALGADVADARLPDRTKSMGMTLFQRDDPDGFDEIGLSWTDTQSLLQRMKFSQGLASNRSFSRGAWDIDAWLAAYALGTGEQILDHFDRVLFAGSLGAGRRAVITTFMNSDGAGAPSPIDSLSGNALTNRIGATVGLILSLPEFQFQ